MLFWFFVSEMVQRLMQQTVFITGNSSGLGYGLSETYIAQDVEVFGLSRRGCQIKSRHLHDIQCDLSNQEAIATALDNLLDNVKQLDLVYLNAGVLGEMRKLNDISISHLNTIMNINVWANKTILDYLFKRNIKIKQVIAISSGAAISANKGWASYSLSKIALNKLVELYADEFPETHFTSLAPGLVDTAMQDYLCDESQVPEEDFPTVKKMREAQGTDIMPSALDAASSIVNLVPRLLLLPSGSYADIRSL